MCFDSSLQWLLEAIDLILPFEKAKFCKQIVSIIRTGARAFRDQLSLKLLDTSRPFVLIVPHTH
jgi:hypothetical protein